MSGDPLILRQAVSPADAEAVRALCRSTGNFSPAEVDVAVELVTERLAKGLASGYHFLFAEDDGAVRGYACFGPIACTLHSWDLFWIVVHKALQGRGLGRRMLNEVERLVYMQGGTRLYIETSAKPQYGPTRAFYEKCDYTKEAELPDFYAAGDGKIIFRKILSPPTPRNLPYYLVLGEKPDENL